MMTSSEKEKLMLILIVLVSFFAGVYVGIGVMMERQDGHSIGYGEQPCAK